MARSLKLLMSALAVTLGAVSLAPFADAEVTSTGRHQACKDYVAIRERPEPSPARDNLRKGQTFVVTGGVGDQYVEGYKLLNNVHGYVLSSSIDKCCDCADSR